MEKLKVYAQEEATKNLLGIRIVTGIVVTVATCAEPFAGTDAHVFLNCASLGNFFLKTIGEDDFERGETRSYAFDTNFTLNSLRFAGIELGHDNTGKGPGWCVANVAIQVRVNGSNQLFLYKQWGMIGWLDVTKAPYYTIVAELQKSN